MPHLTLVREPDGWVIPLVVGVNGQLTATLMAAGQPVPRPVTVRALVDTGRDITAISARVITQLHLLVIQQYVTQTVSGSVAVRLYEVSVSVPRLGRLAGPLLVLDQLVVMDFASPPAGIDALVGLDVLDQLLVILDSSQHTLTLAD